MPGVFSEEVRMMTTKVLRSLQPIETVATEEPLSIVPLIVCKGPSSGDDEVMARKVQWANRAHFSVISYNVPVRYAPYNAVIRISAQGTEDQLRDYLAVLVESAPVSA
jgi:hypothetical protein